MLDRDTCQWQKTDVQLPRTCCCKLGSKGVRSFLGFGYSYYFLLYNVVCMCQLTTRQRHNKQVNYTKDRFSPRKKEE